MVIHDVLKIVKMYLYVCWVLEQNYLYLVTKYNTCYNT